MTKVEEVARAMFAQETRPLKWSWEEEVADNPDLAEYWMRSARAAIAAAVPDLLHWLRQADEYLAADDAEERDDPGNVRRHLRASINAILAEHQAGGTP